MSGCDRAGPLTGALLWPVVLHALGYYVSARWPHSGAGPPTSTVARLRARGKISTRAAEIVEFGRFFLCPVRRRGTGISRGVASADRAH